MALNLLKAAENAEHLKRHTDNGSLTVGSKALPGVDERQVTAMLKTFDNAYAELIAKEAIPVFLPETKKTALQTELTDIAAHSNNSPTTLLRAKLQQKDR